MEKSSLQELCLNRIAKDIQFWCGDAENENFNVYLYVLGPFDHLGKYIYSNSLDYLVEYAMCGQWLLLNRHEKL